MCNLEEIFRLSAILPEVLKRIAHNFASKSTYATTLILKSKHAVIVRMNDVGFKMIAAQCETTFNVLMISFDCI
jgi:hypothetical protein